MNAKKSTSRMNQIRRSIHFSTGRKGSSYVYLNLATRRFDLRRTGIVKHVLPMFFKFSPRNNGIRL